MKSGGKDKVFVLTVKKNGLNLFPGDSHYIETARR